MEWEVVLDGCTRLDGLDLEGGADVGEHRGAEGEGFGVMLLPALVFGAEVKGSRVLQVGGQHNGLVASFARKLDAEVPGIEGDEDEVEVLGGKILGSKCVESSDSISKGTSVSNVLPSQRRQTRCRLCPLAPKIVKTAFRDSM